MIYLEASPSQPSHLICVDGRCKSFQFVCLVRCDLDRMYYSDQRAIVMINNFRVFAGKQVDEYRFGKVETVVLPPCEIHTYLRPGLPREKMYENTLLKVFIRGLTPEYGLYTVFIPLTLPCTYVYVQKSTIVLNDVLSSLDTQQIGVLNRLAEPELRRLGISTILRGFGIKFNIVRFPQRVLGIKSFVKEWHSKYNVPVLIMFNQEGLIDVVLPRNVKPIVLNELYGRLCMYVDRVFLVDERVFKEVFNSVTRVYT